MTSRMELADERIPPNMRGGRFDYLFKRLRNEVVDLTDYIAAELKLSKFVPREFERHVEPTAIGGVTISGIIDRVDALELGDTLYLRVADYKTGATAFSLSDVYYGLGMQMLIYLFALTESGENIKPAGVHYTPARDVMLSMPRSSTDEEIEVKKRARLKGSGIILDEVSEDTVKGVATLEQLGKLARLVGDRLAEVGDALREGRTEPDAALERSSDCQYCGYVSSCGLVRRPEHARNLPKLNDKQFWAMVDSSDDQSSAESAEELG
ncbi:MAG: PD-(D/E)XK nuclease family protein [Oscillospiraceae bacterium]|nr:PD-(D/E)XK nuclease family protein [Oscillospiraceae bacterium]